MIFYCTREKSDLDLGLRLNRVGNSDWNIFFDSGWQVSEAQVSKRSLGDSVTIDYSDTLRITHSSPRIFPIYYTDSTMASFSFDGADLLPIDAHIEYEDGLRPAYQKNFWDRNLDQQLNYQQAVDLTKRVIIDNILKLKLKEKVYLPDQNGVDTLVIRSALDYCNVQYELFNFKDKLPTLSRMGVYMARQHWGYTQISEFNGVLATGFYGDEFVLRNPLYVYHLLKQRGVDLIEVFDDMSDCYMKKYFESYRRKLIDNGTDKQKLMTMIMNDFQIWPINDTHFMTPFRDMRLMSLLNADTDTVIKQITNAEISKSLIKEFNHTYLDRIDRFKNQDDPKFFW